MTSLVNNLLHKMRLFFQTALYTCTLLFHLHLLKTLLYNFAGKSIRASDVASNNVILWKFSFKAGHSNNDLDLKASCILGIP